MRRAISTDEAVQAGILGSIEANSNLLCREEDEPAGWPVG
jgi:hypothetical protein